ncbi:MAG: pilus assembly protein PilZ [Gammaproteobacteria bacterium]|nr:pilus assembly protein PilZ [Gammaproteobacteria bacterium]
MKPSNHAPAMLRLALSDNAVLGACFMPFLQHKGLFVPSLKNRNLGEKVFLVLTLKTLNLTVAGMATVCWITPTFSSDGRAPGYGLHFDEGAIELRAAVAGILSDVEDLTDASISYTL